MSDDVLTFVISASDYQTFRAKLAKIAFNFGVIGSDIVPPVTEAVDPAAPKTARRGRPPRIAESAAAALESEPEEPSLIDPSPPIHFRSTKEFTMDDAKDAGRMVLAKKGVDVLKDVLKKFAVTKVADLKHPQFGEFIEECSNTERL